MRTLCSLVLSILLAVPHGALAGDTGVVTGRVVPSPERGLVAQRVWVGSVPAAVAADGTFRAPDVPAGSVELAIETSEGLYVVAQPVTIAPGSTRSVQLAFGGRQDSNPLPTGVPEKKKHGGVWSNPLYATLIVVGSAIVLGVIVNQATKSSDNSSPSPSTPTN